MITKGTLRKFGAIQVLEACLFSMSIEFLEYGNATRFRKYGIEVDLDYEYVVPKM